MKPLSTRIKRLFAAGIFFAALCCAVVPLDAQTDSASGKSDELSSPSVFHKLSQTAPLLSEPNKPVATADLTADFTNAQVTEQAAGPMAESLPGQAAPVSQNPPNHQQTPKASDLTCATAAALLESTALTGSERIGSTVKIALLLTVLSLVPAILMMTTSFVRIVTVLSILRQGLGTGQIPPTQVLTAIAVFLTLLVMTPTLSEVWDMAVVPYSEHQIDAAEALARGEKPVRTFLWKQIERSGNTDAIWLFMRYVPDAGEPKYYEDIPWRALLPAFMLSELKVAFLIGFQILLPFLVIDLIVSGVMVSMGMMMLPPAVVSLPLKLMLFVLADGWTLVVKSLLEGFVIGG